MRVLLAVARIRWLQGDDANLVIPGRDELARPESILPSGWLPGWPNAPRNDGANQGDYAAQRNDLLQRRDMPGEGAAAGRGGGHRGLRLLADEGLVDAT